MNTLNNYLGCDRVSQVSITRASARLATKPGRYRCKNPRSRHPFWLLGCCLIACAAAASGCEREMKQEYAFVVRVEENERGLDGALVTSNGQKFGFSDAQGRVVVRTLGSEGQVLSVDVACPDNFRSVNDGALLVPLRQVERDVLPEYLFLCQPTKRSVVIGVRADGGEGLPVRMLGRQVARTDASGAAHVVLDVSPLQALELTLDTTEKPELRPKSPTLRLLPEPGQDILVIQQTFTFAQRPTPPRPSQRVGPVRIQ